MTTVSEYAEDNKTLAQHIVKAMFKHGTPVTVNQELTVDQIAFLNQLKPWPSKAVPSQPKQAVYSSRIADKFVVRLPDGLRERIHSIANTKHRSMNSQMIHWLELCVALEEKSENGFTEEDLQAFLDVDPKECVVVPMQHMNYTPATGVPVRVKNGGGVWILRKYIVRNGEAIAILERFSDLGEESLLDVGIDQLEPV